jgi:anti-anti-sigma factor
MTGVNVERFNGIPVARPMGDIDAANAVRVRDRLAETLDRDGDSLVLDLSETRYLDSAGIDMLFRLAERLRRRRARMLLVIPPGSPLMRLAEIVGLPRVVEIHATVEDALVACAQPARA